jgi:hypothetical protein
MAYYTLNAIYNFVSDYAKDIQGVKITHFERYGFNDMEGGQYQINFKVTTAPKYRNKLIKVLTNSTYLEDYDGDTDQEVKEELEENINFLL